MKTNPGPEADDEEAIQEFWLRGRLVQPLGHRRYRIPDGSDRFYVPWPTE
jgi:hypothetical protein